MNIKVSKFLAGITAIICAGVLSFLPFKQVQATASFYFQPSTSNVHVQVFQINNTDITNASITWNIPGVDSSTRLADDDSQVFLMSIDPSQGYAIAASVRFNSLNTIQSGTVNYSFTYDGVNYSGSLQLEQTDFDPYLLTGDTIVYYFDSNNSGDEFSRSINEKINDIDMAFKGLNPDGTVNSAKTVEYVYNGAVSKKIIEKLAQADGVTLLYTFEYEGYVFTSTITSEDAAKIFSKDIPWYGPCYIASNCPTAMVGVAE